MKMINYILLPFFLVLFSFNIKQQSEGDYIVWSKEQKLQWKDFQGIPDKKEIDLGFNAITFVSVKRHIELTKDSITFEIYTIFLYTLSWKTNDASIHLLNHEQRHFDIFEIFSRKYRCEMSDFIKSNMNTLDNDAIIKHYHQLYNKYLELKDLMSGAYDAETNHSRNIEAQERWNKKIDSLLVTLDAYSSPRITIKREQNNNTDVPKNTKSNSPFQSVFR